MCFVVDHGAEYTFLFRIFAPDLMQRCRRF